MSEDDRFAATGAIRENATSSSGRYERVFSVVWRVLSAVTAVLSLIALILSIDSFRLSQIYRRRDLSFEVVPKLYDKFYEMYKIQLDRPYLGHMLATPDRYPEVAHASSIMVKWPFGQGSS